MIGREIDSALEGELKVGSDSMRKYEVHYELEEILASVADRGEQNMSGEGWVSEKR